MMFIRKFTKRVFGPPASMLQRALLGSAFALAMAATATSVYAAVSDDGDPAEPALPQSEMKLDLDRAALVVIDPQVDFPSPDGITWGVVGESVTEHGTVENIEELFKAAKGVNLTTAISPHYYFPHDHGWRFEGALEN